MIYVISNDLSCSIRDTAGNEEIPRLPTNLNKTNKTLLFFLLFLQHNAFAVEQKKAKAVTQINLETFPIFS